MPPSLLEMPTSVLCTPQENGFDPVMMPRMHGVSAMNCRRSAARATQGTALRPCAQLRQAVNNTFNSGVDDLD